VALRLRKVLGRFRRRFGLDRFDIFVRPVLAGDAAHGVPDGYTFRWGTRGDIERCAERHTELDSEDRRLGVARLKMGHRVVLGLCDETVVFSMWLNPYCLNIPGDLKRRLADHQAFIYKAFTSPDHRGRRLYQAGMRFVLADLQRSGLQELVGYAHVKKRASRGGLVALDFHVAGRYHVIRLPGFRSVLVSRRLKGSFPDIVARTDLQAQA